MKKLVARVIGYQKVQEIEINNGIVQSIQALPDAQALGWISQGGVDIQINGALGLAFPDIEQKDIDQIKKICYFLWDQGVDAYLPTIVTTSFTKIKKALPVLKELMQWQKTTAFSGAQILGVHLEGPFLNAEKRGAHPSEFLLPLSIATLEKTIGSYLDIIKVITLAPELDPKHEVIPYLKEQEIIISLGHSQASEQQAQLAFTQGATMVTHAFNAMPPLHHRKPGLLAAAMLNPDVYCGVIADGQHVSPTMIDILLRLSDYDKGVFLVSDALAPLGLVDGIYPWDDRKIEIKKGTARLVDGVLAGTTVSLLTGVKNLVSWGICDIQTAISLATQSPRRALGMPTLQVGSMANLLYWQQQEHGELTWQRIIE
jgi:N-acetylglucosamine-6-phosphate deacetylase